MLRTRLSTLCMVALAAALAACSTLTTISIKSDVQATWKDPKYAIGPMTKIFVISLMKVEPGGRDAVEDAIVARLASVGVRGVASHSVMSSNPQVPGPTLLEAIAASGADGVLMVEVRSVGSYEPGTIGQAVTSLSPDTMASYNYLKQQNVDQPGDYKVANILSELYLPSMGKQVWTAYTNAYDAVNLARNLPDYTLTLIGAMAKDRIIAGAPKPAS